jgi:hypothetical protein
LNQETISFDLLGGVVDIAKAEYEAEDLSVALWSLDRFYKSENFGFD